MFNLLYSTRAGHFYMNFGHLYMTVAVTRKQEAKIEVAELRMLRFVLGETRKNKIQNKHIRGLVQVGQLKAKMREDRLRWYGHAMRRREEYVEKKVMKMGLPGNRRRRRSKRRLIIKQSPQ